MPDQNDAAAQNTEVGKWLTANGASGYASAFHDKGYEEKADLSATVITSIITDKPGLATRLNRLLDDERKKSAPSPTPAETKIPSLPAGTTLDLSQPSVTLPGMPAFTIPPFLSVLTDNAAVVSPGELQPNDWIVLARKNNLLKAYTMENITGKTQMPQAEYAALDWVVPANADFFVSMELSASVTADITYTELAASYVQAGFDRESASAGYAGCSASFEREHKERHAQASDTKHLNMVGRWYYPRARLFLHACTTASASYVTRVRGALAAADPVAAMQAVFKDYGIAVPTEVVLGGQLSFIHTEDGTGTVDEHAAESTVKGAIGVKVGGASSDSSFAFGNSSASKVSSTDIANRTNFTAFGGDTTAASAPANWPATVKRPNLWAVVGVTGPRSIVDLLPDDLKASVMTILPRIPMAPAIWDPAPRSAESQSFRAKTDTFVIARRDTDDQDGSRGTVTLTCGSGESPADNPGAVTGGAAVHRYRVKSLTQATVCLPVPAGQFAQVRVTNTALTPNTHLLQFDTQMALGSWQPGLPGATPVDLTGVVTWTAPGDGFIFCAVSVGNGPRGYVTCKVNDRLMGGASAHMWTDGDGDRWISQNSFCVPVPGGSSVRLEQVASAGQPINRVWWLPSVSQAWRLGQARAYSAATVYQPVEDGFLSGVLDESQARPTLVPLANVLRLYTAPDARSLATSEVSAGAAAEFDTLVEMWLPYNSAMLPVRAGAACRADVVKPASLALSWTPLLPK